MGWHFDPKFNFFFKILGVINFNGINGCLKCTTEGEYSHTSRTATFPNIRCAARTDEKFRMKQYDKHHKHQDQL